MQAEPQRPLASSAPWSLLRLNFHVDIPLIEGSTELADESPYIEAEAHLTMSDA